MKINRRLAEKQFSLSSKQLREAERSGALTAHPGAGLEKLYESEDIERLIREGKFRGAMERLLSQPVPTPPQNVQPNVHPMFAEMLKHFQQVAFGQPITPPVAVSTPVSQSVTTPPPTIDTKKYPHHALTDTQLSDITTQAMDALIGVDELYRAARDCAHEWARRGKSEHFKLNDSVTPSNPLKFSWTMGEDTVTVGLCPRVDAKLKIGGDK